MTLSDQALDTLLKRLHLANTRRAWRELTRRAEKEEWSYRDFLALLVSEEIAQRQQTRLARPEFPEPTEFDPGVFQDPKTSAAICVICG